MSLLGQGDDVAAIDFHQLVRNTLFQHHRELLVGDEELAFAQSMHVAHVAGAVIVRCELEDRFLGPGEVCFPLLVRGLRCRLAAQVFILELGNEGLKKNAEEQGSFEWRP